MAAALRDTPADRRATMMQFLFLQGADPSEPLELQVTPLQDGKRFSARHVRGVQASARVVLDAQVACAVELDAPRHEATGVVPEREDPAAFPSLDDVDADVMAGIRRLGGYADDRKLSIEFRIPAPRRQFVTDARSSEFRFWMRATEDIGDDPATNAAAFAYMSDWWINFSSLISHQGDVGGRRLYVASLNHAIWLHRPVDPAQWLHVSTKGPTALSGRGLSVGLVHGRDGRHLATVTQEVLMAYAD